MIDTNPTSGTDPQKQDELIGTVLGDRYTIERMIGRGGMGLVYLATQEEAPREVVVKVLAPRWLTNSEAVARFDREARNLRTLRHTNIVEMFDYGRHDDRGYLVMEYIRGEPLSRHLAERGRLTSAEFVPLAAQILKGIGYAHSREMIVRDIKPDNVMLCVRHKRANFVKILDFGLAKLVQEEQPITSEFALGTIGFIAPETIAGAPADLRVDVYALGVLFYNMVSGKMPLRPDPGNGAAALYRTISERAVPLAEALPADHDVPDGLIHLIESCLQKDPNARPDDANVLVEMLIDVFPAAMFRLRRADGVPTRVSEQQSSSGRIAMGDATPIPSADLLVASSVAESLRGSRAKDLAFEVDDASSSSRSTDESLPVTSPDSPLTTSPITVEIYNRGRRTALTIGLLFGGVGAALAVVAMMWGGGGAEARPEVAAAPASVPEGEAAPTNDGDTVRTRAPGPDASADGGDVEAVEGAPAVMGTLRLSSDPSGAAVSLDGRPLGVTPFDGRVAVGSHTLELTADGHAPWSTTVTVTEDGMPPVEAKLEARDVGAPHRKRRSSRSAGREPDAPSSTAAASPTPGPSPTATSKPSPLISGTKPKKDDVLLAGDEASEGKGLIGGSN